MASVVNSSTASSRRLMAADVGQRIRQPIGQQPGAHRRDGFIDHRQQAAVALAFAERARQFQAAAGGFVDEQARAAAIRLQLA